MRSLNADVLFMIGNACSVDHCGVYMYVCVVCVHMCMHVYMYVCMYVSIMCV